MGLAFDGRNLLVADTADYLSIVTSDGYGLGGWIPPTMLVGGLTYSPHRVWSGERYGYEVRIFGIVDTISVGPGGREYREVPDTLVVSGGACRGLAWNGDHLLVACDSLYVLTVEGEIVSAYDFPVMDVRHIAWDGEGVWMISRGPKGLMSEDRVVTRFKLP